MSRESHQHRNLAFMACPEEDFVRLVAELREIDDGWTLVCFYPPPIQVPQNMRVMRSAGAVGTAMRLWMSSLVRRFDRVAVCCRDLTQPTALAPVLEFVSLCRSRDRCLIDTFGRRQSIAAAHPGTAVATARVPILLFLSQIVTRLGLLVVKSATPSIPRRRNHGRRTVILLPILPDLSHTFVYREALELKRRHPEYLVAALEQGDQSVVHREAADLLQVTTFVPRLTAVPYLLAYLSAWFRQPSSMAALVRFFQSHTSTFGPGALANDPFCFLRLEYLQHSNYLTVGFMLADFLRRNDVGYIHVYGSTYPAVRMLIAHRLLGIPYSVSTFVDFDYPTPFHMIDQKFRPARFVVVCTEYCRQKLRARFPDLQSTFRTLHHALPRGYAAVPNFRPPDGRSRVVFVGRFVPKKGLDTLIRSFAILRDHGTAVTCHLYGAGPDEDFLRGLVDELDLGLKVFFEGTIANQDFYTTMNRDDVFACTCRYMPDGERDGIPVTLLEVMAAGIAVVSTPVSGIPELVVHGENGYLVAADEPDALARLLTELVADPSRRQAVSASAIRTIDEKFSLDRTIDCLDGWITQESALVTENVERATVRADGSG